MMVVVVRVPIVMVVIIATFHATVAHARPHALFRPRCAIIHAPRLTSTMVTAFVAATARHMILAIWSTAPAVVTPVLALTIVTPVVAIMDRGIVATFVAATARHIILAIWSTAPAVVTPVLALTIGTPVVAIMDRGIVATFV